MGPDYRDAFLERVRYVITQVRTDLLANKYWRYRAEQDLIDRDMIELLYQLI